MKKASLFFLLFYSCFAVAQNCGLSFRGVVYDLHEKIPLKNVKVTFFENDKVSQTDTNGEFYLTGLCERTYTVFLEHPSCTPVKTTVKLPFFENKNFYLEHHITELEEIVLLDSQKSHTTKTSVESTLSNEEIIRFSSKSLGDLVSQLSGVSNIKTGNAIVKPLVHGMYGSRIAIVNNGVRLQDHEWGIDHAPSVDINGVDQLQLIKGVSALKYGGDMLGGVIQLIPKKFSLKDSLLGNVSSGFDSQGNGTYLLANLTKTQVNGFNYGGNISLKNAGDLKNPNYVLSNTGNREVHTKVNIGRNTITQAWNLHYNFYKKETGILSAAHLGSSNDLARAIESNIPLVISPATMNIKSPRQITVHQSINLFYERWINNTFNWDIRYSFQHNNRKEFDLRRGEAKYKPALDLRLKTHDFLANLKTYQANNFQWNTGISFQIQDNFSNPDTGVRRLIPDYFRIKAGGYLLAQFTPSNTLNTELGIRYDYDHIDAYKYYRINDWDERKYNDDFSNTIISTSNLNQHLTQQIKKYSNLSASAGVKLFLGNQTYIYSNLGYINRSPNPAELFADGLHHANARYESGDIRLTQEKALKTLVSIEKEKGKFNYSIVGHMSSIKDFIFIKPIGIRRERGVTIIQANYQQLPKVMFQGLDIDLGYRVSNQLVYKGTFSFVVASTEKDIPLVDIPPANLVNEVLFSPKKIPFINLIITSKYVNKQNRFPNFNFVANFIENGTIVQKQIDISSSPSQYHLVNFDISASLGKKWKLTVGVENMFNVDYRNYLNRLRYYAGETGRNIGLEINYIF